jgi:uncharacterized protein YaaR (DUF327 family)
MEPITTTTKQTEKVEGKAKPEPMRIFNRNREQIEKDRIKSLQESFMKEIGRELTKEEMGEYLYLFKLEKTNFWHYAKKIQDTNQVPILRQLAQ